MLAFTSDCILYVNLNMDIRHMTLLVNFYDRLQCSLWCIFCVPAFVMNHAEMAHFRPENVSSMQKTLSRLMSQSKLKFTGWLHLLWHLTFRKLIMKSIHVHIHNIICSSDNIFGWLYLWLKCCKHRIVSSFLFKSCLHSLSLIGSN